MAVPTLGDPGALEVNQPDKKPRPPKPPPVPTQGPDVRRLSLDDQASYIKGLNERAGLIPQEFVNDAPNTAAWLIGSSLPTSTLSDVGRLLGNWPWLKSINGPDGLTMTQKALALRDADPDMRRVKLALINGTDQGVAFQQPFATTSPQQAQFQQGVGQIPDPKTIYIQALKMGLNTQAAKNAVLFAMFLSGAGGEVPQTVADQIQSGQISPDEFRAAPDANQLGKAIIQYARNKPLGYKKFLEGLPEAIPLFLLALSGPAIGGVAAGAAIAGEAGTDIAAGGIAAAAGTSAPAAAIAGPGFVGGPIGGTIFASQIAGGVAPAFQSATQNAQKIPVAGPVIKTAGISLDSLAKVGEGVNTAFGRITDVVGGSVLGGAAALTGRNSMPFKSYVWGSPGSGTGNALADIITNGNRQNPFYEPIASTANLVAGFAIPGEAMRGVAAFRSAGTEIPVPEGEQTPGFKQMLKSQYGVLGRFVYDMRASGFDPYKWATDGRDSANWVFDQAWKRVQESPDKVGEIRDSLKVTAEQADYMQHAQSAPELARAWAATVRNTPDATMLEEWTRERDQAKADLVENRLSPEEADALGRGRGRKSADTRRVKNWVRTQGGGSLWTDYARDHVAEMPSDVRVSYQRRFSSDPQNASKETELKAQVAYYDSLISKPLPTNISLDRPTNGILKQAFRLAERDTPIADMIGAVPGFGALPVPRISRLFDRLYQSRLVDWLAPSAPADSLEQNAKYVENVTRRAGLSHSQTRHLIDAMVNARDEDAQYEWLKEYHAALSDSRLVASDKKADLSRMFTDTNSATSARATFPERLPDGTVTERGVAQYADAQGRPIRFPVLSSERLAHLPSPDIWTITDATSFSRHVMRMAGRLSERSRIGNIAVSPLLGTQKFLSWLSRTSTNIFKPTSLAVRAAPVVLRSLIDDESRLLAAGYKLKPSIHRQFGASAVRDTTIFDTTNIDIKGLGGILRDEWTLPTRNRFIDFNPTDYTPDVAQHHYDRLMIDHAAPELRRLVKYNDPVRWADWVRGPGEMYRSTLERAVERDPSISSLEELGSNLLRHVDDITGGNARLRKGLVDGWVGDGLKENDHGETPWQELVRTGDELSHLDDAMWEAQAQGDNPRIQTLIKTRQELRGRQEFLRRVTAKAKGGIELSDRNRVVAEMQRLVKNGEMKAPFHFSAPIEERPRFSTRKELGQSVSEVFAAKVYSSAPFRLLGAVDENVTRIPFYRQAARDVYDHLTSLGWSHDKAVADAEVQAMRRTAGYFYNLTARSSAERFLRNIFWYAPPFVDSLKKWLIDIPSRYYPILGHAYLYNRAHLIAQFADQTGILKKDAYGKPYVTVPGLGPLLSKITGVPMRDVVTFNPQQLSLVTASLPGLSPVYGEALRRISDHASWMKPVSDALVLPGSETTFGPAALSYAYEAITGQQPTWEVLAQDFQGHVYDSAFDDAVRQAWAKGLAEKKFTAASWATMSIADRQKMQDWVFHEADDIFRWNAVVHLAGSTLSPAPLHTSDEWRNEITGIYQTMYGKEPKNHQSQEHADWQGLLDNRVNQFLTEHPNAFAYTVSKTARGDTDQLPADVKSESGLNRYYDELATGYKKTLDGKTYIQMVGGWSSYRYLIDRTQNQIAQAVGAPSYDKVSWRDYLLHGGQIQVLLAERHRAWDDYLNANPDFQAEYNRAHILAAKNGTPQPDFGTTDLKKGLDTLILLEPFFSTNGVRSGDIKKIEGEFKFLIGQAITFTGSSSNLGKGLDWYHANVLDPYDAQVEPLYAQADAVNSRGGDPGPIYDKIRDIENQWAEQTKKMTFGGQQAPPPEEMFFSNLRQGNGFREQDNAIASWITRPVSWLTDFQRSKSGYPSDPRASKFFSDVTSFRDKVSAYVTKNAISTSSNYYSFLQDWENTQVENYAKSLGQTFWNDQGTGLAQIDQAPTYVRVSLLRGVPGAPTGPTWDRIVGAVRQIEQRAVQGGFSLKGESNQNTAYKEWLFANVDAARKQDPAFDKLMGDLEDALSGSTVRHGPLAYNAIFFNDYGPSYSPKGGSSLTDASSSTAVTIPGGDGQIINANDPSNLVSQAGVTLQAPALQSLLNVSTSLGYTIRVVSSYRTLAEQTAIYNSGVRPAAPPGRSLHERGLAIDVDGAFLAAHPEVRNALLAAGWHQFDPVSDPGHFSFQITG